MEVKITTHVLFTLRSGIIGLCALFMISCNNTKNMQTKTPTSNITNGNDGQSALQKQLKDDVDFYAAGQQGSWELNLDFERDFQFKRADGFVFNTPAVEGIKAQDANVARYRAMVESGEMIIQLYKQECINGSTGQKFPYKVSVEIKRGIDKEYTQFEGCGRYLFDERIHDIWVLQQLNGKAVTGSDLPYIEFNTLDGKILGKTGCNNFSGKADFKGNKLTLGPLAASRKFCPNATYETDFLKAMSPGEWTYEIDKGKLFLTRNNNDAIIFRKID